MILKTVGLGAGGHARVLIEILSQIPKIRIVGLLDPDRENRGKRICGIPVLGSDALLLEMANKNIRHAFIGVGMIDRGNQRRLLCERVQDAGLTLVSVVHTSAVIAPSASLGSGLAILAGAVVGTNASLATNVIVNSGAVVEHDCIIGDHVHIASGAILGGGVRVGADTLIGLGARIRQNIQIGKDVVVGTGAVVVADVPDGETVIGVPARPMRLKCIKMH